MSLSQSPHHGVIIFAGGGTGGHLFPALSVADALHEQAPQAKVIFLASDREIDRRILDPTGWEWHAQTARPPRAAPWKWWAMVRGWRQSVGLCRSLFRSHPPAVVMGSGGYASVPPMVVARRMGIATAILNPDCIPGRASRFLARSVDQVFVQWAESGDHFPRGAHIQQTGCPVRAEFQNPRRDQGVREFNLDPLRKTLLVTGASLGARTVNETILAALPQLKECSDWQVLHLTGDADCVRVSDAYNRLGVLGKVLPFTSKMPLAMACSDLVVSRAGASTLAEITALGKPSILMPYPYHRDLHQLANARVLERHGAARIVMDQKDPTVNVTSLLACMLPLLADDETRKAMSDRARQLGRPHAASDIAQRLLSMACIR